MRSDILRSADVLRIFIIRALQAQLASKEGYVSHHLQNIKRPYTWTIAYKRGLHILPKTLRCRKRFKGQQWRSQTYESGGDNFPQSSPSYPLTSHRPL